MIKKLFIIIIIIVLLGASYYYLNYQTADDKPESSHIDSTTNLLELKERMIVFFDPTIYEEGDSNKLQDIHALFSKELLKYDNLKNGKEFILWIVEDQMTSQKESHRTIFKLDVYATEENNKYPQLKPCLNNVKSIISARWQLKHSNHEETKKLASCIIESLFILDSKYDLNEKTEIVFISDMLQESSEYNMKLEAFEDWKDINSQFDTAINSLNSKKISIDFSMVNSFTIYQVTSSKLTTTGKAQAIKDGWISFFKEFCKIDSTKILYYTNN